MASERTCGECRDCRYYSAARRGCDNVNTPVVGCDPDFGCVLFAAKPAPQVAALLELRGDVSTLVGAQELIETFKGNVSPVRDYTHVYNSANHSFLFRYEEETP